ncbi:MAG TPA: ABC transporter [Clostridiales bacterium]|nr:ABC transporter [Clostridiales bacterium]
MIEINKLTKRYGQIEAVKNISFTVNEGEILGFLGPNGAGKSTTMNIITGYLPATEGSVKVDGFDILEEPEEVKKRIGFLPEQPPVYKDMTVSEYLKFVSDLKYVPKSKQKAQLDDIMELCGITDHVGRLIKNLSKGYRQRVGLAQSLIGNPDVLVLDEPTVGLDPKQIIEIRNLIKSLGKKHTIILSSHILPEVSAVCERVVIINKGEIAAVDTPENLSKGLNSASRLTATIAGPQNQVSKLINDIYGVKYNEVLGKPNKDTLTYVIESDKEIDVRRPLFFAMAKAGYPIIELRSMDMTLEDIFLKVTTVEEGVH